MTGTTVHPTCLTASKTRPDQIDPADFDAIYFNGGHAVMWDFPAE